MQNTAQTDLAAALAVHFHPLTCAESELPFAWRAEVTGSNGWTIDGALGVLKPAEADALACYCASLAIRQAVARGLGRTEALLILPVSAVCAASSQVTGEIVHTAKAQGLPIDRIIVEISGGARDCLESAERLAEACTLDGLAIALGDFAADRVGLNLLTRFKPRFARLDRGLVRTIGSSDSRRLIVESALRLARSLGTTLVAPAAETQDERDTLRRIGIAHAERSTALWPLPSAVAPRRAPRTIPIGTQRDASIVRRAAPAGSFATFEALVAA